MAAGQGFKTFTTGEVLTAADVNGYLMQGVLVFASEAARDAAITSPQEGQFAYTKDNNSLWYYTGSAWAASGATGDIEGVTAGVGISGGGTSGTVTITNSMATAITTNGDLIYGTGSGTFTRRAIGSTGDVLTVAGGVPTWAAPSGGSFTTAVNNVATQQATTSTSYTDLATVGAQVTITTGTKALVSIVGQLAKTGSATPVSKISFAISGATTLAAADNPYSLQFEMTDAVGGAMQFGGSWIVTGLTAGSNVFTMKYKDAGGGTSYFANRTISVLNLGS
jgi:hypothetical protein